MNEPTYPDVQVQLIGEDGNVFGIIGRVSRALRRAGYGDAATEFSTAAFAAHSYDEVLQMVMSTVEVT